jgi:transcriptional regulator with XRE-family HTH domain
MPNLADEFDWRAALRAHRIEQKMSQRQLARRAGLSASAIKAYENGSRHPSVAALDALIASLGITRERANPIRAGAGYAVDWYSLLNERFVPEPDLLTEQVERYPWPVFVANQAYDVVATNKVFQAVWDVDLESEYLGMGERNLLAGASDPRFADCIENYDEVITFMIGLAKGDPRFVQNPERPAPWIGGPLQKFLEGDAAYVSRLLRLWESAPPVPHRIRHMYEVRWRYRGELSLRFLGIVTLADIWNELSWNDWVPADTETWSALRAITEEA